MIIMMTGPGTFTMLDWDEIVGEFPNRIFRYIVYAYICISGFIILITN
jgi:hypothetical protein